MKIRIYCEECEKEYVLESGEPWVGLMTCPHEISSHKLKEVIEDVRGGDNESNTVDTQHYQ